MKGTNVIKSIKWFSTALGLILLCCTGVRAQVNAASCSSKDVQSAINSASSGQTVNVPSGNCSWGTSAVSLSKAIILNGAGQGATNIDVSGGNPAFTIAQPSSGTTYIQNLTFTASNNENTPHTIEITGTWPPKGAVVFEYDTFMDTYSTFLESDVAGGVIISHITFNGNQDGALITVKDLTDTNSWTSPNSLGTNDTTGLMNIYIEDSAFNNGWNGIVDCDDNCRMVFRHNTLTNSGGFNSHGEATSPFGMRQFEIYDNVFKYPNPNNTNVNLNWFIWIRGGSGVIWGNTMDELYGSSWGDKSEVGLTIRGAEDNRPQGSCAQVNYPVPHQIGQSNNGKSDFTDPIYFWGNTSTASSPHPSGDYIQVSGGWGWGNPCGFDWNTFFQWGRDGVNTSLKAPITLSSGGGSVEGEGGTAKPGYTPYPYPHPLVTGQGTQSSGGPAAPTGLVATVQ